MPIQECHEYLWYLVFELWPALCLSIADNHPYVLDIVLKELCHIGFSVQFILLEELNYVIYNFIGLDFFKLLLNSLFLLRLLVFWHAQSVFRMMATLCCCRVVVALYIYIYLYHLSSECIITGAYSPAYGRLRRVLYPIQSYASSSVIPSFTRHSANLS